MSKALNKIQMRSVYTREVVSRHLEDNLFRNGEVLVVRNRLASSTRFHDSESGKSWDESKERELVGGEALASGAVASSRH